LCDIASAVQVVTLGYRCPFITDQGGKVARIVETVGSFGDIFPDIVIDSRTWRILLSDIDQTQRRRANRRQNIFLSLNMEKDFYTSYTHGCL